MNRVHLFVDDESLKANTTEFNDLYIKTTDISAWGVWLDGDEWPKNSRGYNISFQIAPDRGFHLELNDEGMHELLRVIRDTLESEVKYRKVMNDV